MRKLMFAVAAVAAGVAMADVTSANIVGYAGSQLRDEGATLTTALFQSVAAKNGETTFGSIVPVAEEGVDLSGAIEIQYLLDDGSTDWDNDYYWDGSVWLKDGITDASETPVIGGQGMWVVNQSGAPVSFQSSGEVNQKELEYPIREEGATAAANAFPCATTFGRIVPVAEEGVDLSGAIEIQFLLDDGSTDWDNDYYWDGSAWLKDGMTDASETPVIAGQGMWVVNQSGAPVMFHIAAPEL